MIVVQRMEAVGAPVAKHGLTVDEVEASLGSASLVKELREAGLLEPCGRKSKALLFDAADVARAWAEFREGRYDGQLATWRSTKG